MLHRNTSQQDLEKALADIETEKTSGKTDLVSGHPSSQAILLAKKRQDRMRDGETFHAFILTQTSPDKTEFSEFIEKLKACAHEIKPGTRILLNVITTYVDQVFDKDLYDAGRRECAHWSPVDLLIENDHSVSSVILDASDTFGFRRMHSELKAMFPDKEHFIFRGDTIVEKDQTKRRLIQTQPVGCRVFSVEHIKQLTQIPADELRKEIRAIADETGTYTAGNMRPNSKILRVLRGMQSLSGLQALTPEVRRSPIQGRKTLEDAYTGTVEGRINTMVTRRSAKYKIKKREYVDLLAPGELKMIMETKSGFEYLNYPILFALSDKLTLASRESVDKMLAALKQKCLDKNIGSQITGLTDSGLSNECLKSKLLFRLESSFIQLDNNGEKEKCQQLAALLKEVMPLLQASTLQPRVRHLSPDVLFAVKRGRSSVPERHTGETPASSPVVTPSSTPVVPRITIELDVNDESQKRPPTLNFPK